MPTAIMIKCSGPNCSAEYHRQQNWFMVTCEGKFIVHHWNPEFEQWPDTTVKKVCGLRCAVALLDRWMQEQLRK